MLHFSLHIPAFLTTKLPMLSSDCGCCKTASKLPSTATASFISNSRQSESPISLSPPLNQSVAAIVFGDGSESRLYPLTKRRSEGAIPVAVNYRLIDIVIVHEELVKLMDGDVSELVFAKSGPTVILLAGLQGVGKTTVCAKVAFYLKKQVKSCMLIAVDVYRPAAIEQLVILGEKPNFSGSEDCPWISKRYRMDTTCFRNAIS